MPQPLEKTQRYSYADLLGWPEDERWELHDGVAVSMSPAPSPTHQRMVGELYFQIRASLTGHPCEVFVAPLDVRLAPTGTPAAEVDTVVQPDLVVICDRTGLDERGFQGAPDWVIEVLSPSTSARDQITKLALYEAHGVRCYWLVHPIDRIVTVYSRRDASEPFGRPTISETKGQQASGIIDGLTIDWDQLPA